MIRQKNLIHNIKIYSFNVVSDNMILLRNNEVIIRITRIVTILQLLFAPSEMSQDMDVLVYLFTRCTVNKNRMLFVIQRR